VHELIRTNDLVLISFVEALLKSAEIDLFVADGFISATEGSIGLFPRRLLVPEHDAEEARRILIDNGLEKELGHG
jgi:hypothetical protein